MVNTVEYNEKLDRIRMYLSLNCMEAMILGSRENFAWMTGGGNNKIFWTSEAGFGILLITKEKVYLIAQKMDADRIYDDELAGLDIEKISLGWMECSKEEKALMLADGVCVSDMQIDGAEYRPLEIAQLQYPLMPTEIERYRLYCKQADEVIMQVAGEVGRGMTEKEVEIITAKKFIENGFGFKTLLIGSDERIKKYRHPNPSDKKIEKTLLIHPGTCKGGMNIYITRMMSFGKADVELAEKYACLNRMLANAASMCAVGKSMWNIIDKRRELLKEFGYENEFFNHYPGAVCGYFTGSAQPIIDDWEITEGVLFNWFITVTGAKVEEMVLSGADGGEILSACGAWPKKNVSCASAEYKLPVILEI